MIDSMLSEFQQETATTKRLLERVPEEQLSWRPHPKSMSLGQLSLHVASIPGNIVGLAQQEGFDASQANFTPPEVSTVNELLTAFETSIKTAENYLSGLDEKTASGNWRLTSAGKEIFTIPRIGMLRTVMLNHWYHHRGQLTVYLRLLDVPLPVIYGRSADENPFA